MRWSGSAARRHTVRLDSSFGEQNKIPTDSFAIASSASCPTPDPELKFDLALDPAFTITLSLSHEVKEGDPLFYQEAEAPQVPLGALDSGLPSPFSTLGPTV